MEREKPLGMRIGESVFCAGYLVFALVAGCMLITCAPGTGAWASTCGAMTLLLGCGDAFHLIPRILVNLRGTSEDPNVLRRRSFALGLGNLVSSITMTAFYLLLFVGMWQMAHPSQGMAFPPLETGAACWSPYALYSVFFRRTDGSTAQAARCGPSIVMPRLRSWA